MMQHRKSISQKIKPLDFPGGPVVKNLPANAEDMGSIPGLERSNMSQNSLAHDYNY